MIWPKVCRGFRNWLGTITSSRMSGSLHYRAELTRWGRILSCNRAPLTSWAWTVTSTPALWWPSTKKPAKRSSSTSRPSKPSQTMHSPSAKSTKIAQNGRIWYFYFTRSITLKGSRFMDCWKTVVIGSRPEKRQNNRRLCLSSVWSVSRRLRFSGKVRNNWPWSWSCKWRMSK